MNYKSMVLNKLLDKYEERVQNSNRRVRIVCSRNEVKIPDIESYEYQDFRNDMLYLKTNGFIELDWVQKDYIINSIWLNLDNTEAAYHYLERESRTAKVTAAVKRIDTALKKVTTGWIYSYLTFSRDNILSMNKLTGIWNKDRIFLKDFLASLKNLDKLNGNAVSMRAFSIKTYGDSKKFEREIKQHIVPVIKKFEPDLLDDEEISDRAVLAQVGIIMMPEVFEFCGNVKVHFTNGTVDFSPISKGACISSESISDIVSIDISETDTRRLQPLQRHRRR